VIEVPLRALLGTYLDTARTTSFQLPSRPSAVRSVSLRVHGTTRFATYSCDGPNGYGPQTPVETGINVEMSASPGYWVTGQNNEAPGTFGWTREFVPFFGATWAFLLDGTGELWLAADGESAVPECFLVGPRDFVTLDDVTLLVDGDFPTASEARSWGRIKAIYR